MTIQTYDMLIDGDWVQASDGTRFTTFDPATGTDWCEVPEASPEDVDRAIVQVLEPALLARLVAMRPKN